MYPSELNLWISSSVDGYVNLYTLPSCKLVRSIKLQEKKCSYAFLINSPIPCITVICDGGGNSEIFVYSINGKIISRKQEYFRIVKPIIVKDANFNEYMAYLGNHSVYITKLPNLELILNIDEVKNSHILCCNDNLTTLYVLDKNGSINLIRDEEDGTITYKEYPENLDGIIESNLDRFGTDYNKDVYAQWVKYATNFIKS